MGLKILRPPAAKVTHIDEHPAPDTQRAHMWAHMPVEGLARQADTACGIAQGLGDGVVWGALQARLR